MSYVHQNKDSYVRSLAPYMPVQQSAVNSLMEQTAQFEQREVRLACKELGAPQPREGMTLHVVQSVIAKMELRSLLDHPDDGNPEDHLPHYFPVPARMLVYHYYEQGASELFLRQAVIWSIIEHTDGRHEVLPVGDSGADAFFISDVEGSPEWVNLQRLYFYEIA